MEQITDRQLMVAEYQLVNEINRLTKQLNEVRTEINKRVNETINGKEYDSSNNSRGIHGDTNNDGNA
jgi:hypothetical protein